MNYNEIDTTIPVIGEEKIPSPIQRGKRGAQSQSFVSDTERIITDVNLDNLTMMIKEGKEIPSFEMAGPRRKIYFDPSKLKCALVTCGGLCPGLNDIIRSIVLELFYGYGVRNICGIRYGLQGFISKYGHDVMDLKPETVVNILEMGGTILGSSRGPQPIDEIVDCLERMNIGILFMIGGDGTLMAACKIADAFSERGLMISVVGIPKTIDNDIHLVSRSFGFDTAVDVATQAIRGAHYEAMGYPNGIDLIKLMGRHSGFIAATTTLAQQDVDEGDRGGNLDSVSANDPNSVKIDFEAWYILKRLVTRLQFKQSKETAVDIDAVFHTPGIIDQEIGKLDLDTQAIIKKLTDNVEDATNDSVDDLKGKLKIEFEK